MCLNDVYIQDQNILIFNILKWSKNSVRAGQPGPAPVFLSYLPYFLSRFLPRPKSWHLWLHHMSSPAQTTTRTRTAGGNSLKSQATSYPISTCECGIKAIKNYFSYLSFFLSWNVLTLRTCLCARVISCPLPLLFSDPHQSRLCHDIISHLTPHSSVLEIRILITSPQPQTESQNSSCCRDLMPVCYVLPLESFLVSFHKTRGLTRKSIYIIG